MVVVILAPREKPESCPQSEIISSYSSLWQRFQRNQSRSLCLQCTVGKINLYQCCDKTIHHLGRWFTEYCDKVLKSSYSDLDFSDWEQNIIRMSDSSYCLLLNNENDIFSVVSLGDHGHTQNVCTLSFSTKIWVQCGRLHDSGGKKTDVI